MKVTLVLAANVVLSLARRGLADECHNICADVNKGISSKSGCKAFRNSLPRAKISSKCQSGFKAAVDMNCYDACANGGYLQPFVSERRLKEVCNGALKDTPRPLCHDACVRGYRSGVKDMSTLLVKRMAEGAPKVLTALKQDTLARQKVAQRAHVTATDSLVGGETSKPIASADSKAPASTAVVEPGLSGTVLDAEEVEPVESGETESQKPEEGESVDAVAGETEEVHGVDEEPPLSADEIGKVENEGDEKAENEDHAAIDVDGEVIEPHEAGNNEENIYKWPEQEEKVLLSLPITVDNVEKELAIFEGDEPMDVVLEFCRDNMPGEASCADELIGVVVDKISPRHAMIKQQ